MDLIHILALSMFAVLLLTMMLGVPVFFSLSGTALIFAVIGHYLDLFYLTDLGFVPSRIFGVMSNYTLVAVPLFIFMGLMLEKSQLAEELLEAITKITKNRRGSSAVAVVVVGAILAASTGIVGATVVTMGVISLPTLLQQGYSKRLASGIIAASGTLGQIIPPSIVLVILGDIMNLDIGDLFIAALIPGGLLVAAYTLWGIFASNVLDQQELTSADQSTHTMSLRENIIYIARTLFPPFVLIFIVLGSILMGLASPTEAASCGAVGAMVIAIFKRKLNWQNLNAVNMDTVKITSMVFMLLVGAQFFGVVFRGLEGDFLIQDWILGSEISPSLTLFFIMVLLFVLGFFLDFLEICFIVIPIILPIITQLGFEPLWVAILIAVNLQTSFLTPPFGFSLFYLKGVAPSSVTTMDIYKGITPFVLIQLLIIGLLAAFPSLSLWLPHVVFD